MKKFLLYLTTAFIILTASQMSLANCEVVGNFDDVKYFDTKSEAQAFCQDVERIFGVRTGCFIRDLGDDFFKLNWEANFKYVYGFYGSNYQYAFGKFTNFQYLISKDYHKYNYPYSVVTKVNSISKSCFDDDDY